jgi:hypothetical protein
MFVSAGWLLMQAGFMYKTDTKITVLSASPCLWKCFLKACRYKVQNNVLKMNSEHVQDGD